MQYIFQIINFPLYCNQIRISHGHSLEVLESSFSNDDLALTLLTHCRKLTKHVFCWFNEPIQFVAKMAFHSSNLLLSGSVCLCVAHFEHNMKPMWWWEKASLLSNGVNVFYVIVIISHWTVLIPSLVVVIYNVISRLKSHYSYSWLEMGEPLIPGL